MKLLLTPEEARKKIGISKFEFDTLVSKGEIPIIRLSSHIRRIRSEDLENINLNKIEPKKADELEEETKTIIGAVYFIGSFDEIYQRYKHDEERYCVVKIGFTTKLKKRLKRLQTYFPIELNILGVIEEVTYEIERNLHGLYSDRNTIGEWFYFKHDMNDRLFRKIDKHSIGHRGTYKRLMKKYQ